jgi:hypothetical protein
MSTESTLEDTFKNIDDYDALEEMEQDLRKRIGELKQLIEKTNSRNKKESIRHMRNIISLMKRQLKELKSYKKNKQKESDT